MTRRHRHKLTGQKLRILLQIVTPQTFVTLVMGVAIVASDLTPVTSRRTVTDWTETMFPLVTTMSVATRDPFPSMQEHNGSLRNPGETMQGCLGRHASDVGNDDNDGNDDDRSTTVKGTGGAPRNLEGPRALGEV